MVSHFQQLQNLIKSIKGESVTDEISSFVVEGKTFVTVLSTWLPVVQEFKDSLYVTFMPPTGDSFVLKEDTTLPELSEFIDELNQLGISEINVQLNLNKSKYLEKTFPGSLSIGLNLFLFIYIKNFINWLESVSFDQLEKILRAEFKTVFVIMDEDILFENQYISIIGGISRENIDEFINNCTFDRCDFNRDIINSRNNNCNWTHGTVFLTPLHFNFVTEKCANETVLSKITEVVNRKYISLVLPFLASSTDKNDEKIVATFQGYKSTKVSMDKCPEVDPETLKNIHLLYLWAYDSKTTDKLGMLRNICSLYLGEDSDKNLGVFISNVSDILNSVQSSFEIYLKDNIKNYFDQRKKLDEFIQGKVKEVSQEITTVLGLISKNLITTITVLLGAALSYINSGNKYLVVGVVIGFIVLLTIQTVYYATFTRASVMHAEDSLKQHVNYIKKTFTEREVNELVGNTFEKKKTLFFKYWWPTLVISISLLVCGIYVLFNIESLLKLFPPKINVK